MPDIELSREQTDHLVSKIKDYFEQELDQDIGGFEAEFLIQFLAREVGPYFYNRGLTDAQVLLNEKIEDLGYMLEEMHKVEAG
ncbi:hypothetical protein GCM10011403_28810 [Pseudohongiella nitratireducens]|uniref:DUF2164 domain-containing protein n=1 Tax=Pseudohongiella nitratireducens TaxID=1768907 RepID=A0A916QM15_9GAMM|nr:DUF2164 domain-containing protein [Pseudohongiella nitratireducens]MDF1623132.1 DUF2164 domain-containing protein [Pseudohongiella nitratireducens]GFZ83399.1 hypothetical protein GCM10011403_28810 [Pseudohongiella nitratireducens]|tara:strand:- start:2744 stop:2992 length:249 start_codon:yes stop_codon:yes gene_type:complete